MIWILQKLTHLTFWSPKIKLCLAWHNLIQEDFTTLPPDTRLTTLQATARSSLFLCQKGRHCWILAVIFYDHIVTSVVVCVTCKLEFFLRKGQSGKSDQRAAKARCFPHLVIPAFKVSISWPGWDGRPSSLAILIYMVRKTYAQDTLGAH